MAVHLSLDLNRYQQQRLFDLVVDFIRENRYEKYTDGSFRMEDAEQWRLMMQAVASSAHIEVAVRIGESLRLVPKK